jgi:hypothetical protein
MRLDNLYLCIWLTQPCLLRWCAEIGFGRYPSDGWNAFKRMTFQASANERAALFRETL